MNKLLNKSTKDVTKDIVSKLHEHASTAEDCISLLQTAFIYNTSSPLVECSAKTAVIKNEEVALTEQITENAHDNQDMNKYVSIPSHLSRIAVNIEKISELIDKKNQGMVLFSDKAVNEIMFLLQRLSEIIRPASDIILARNKFLGTYVQESQAGIESMANEYSTLHEERLIGGECLPVASSQFLGMLDAIKNIAWHTKEITVKLTS